MMLCGLECIPWVGKTLGSRTVRDDMVETHLPQFSPVHAVVGIEEQTTVVKRREPQARISVGVGRGVVRVVLRNVNDHPRGAVGWVMRPKFTARAVGCGVKVHHAADAHHHAHAWRAAVCTGYDVGCTPCGAVLGAKRPEFRPARAVFELEEGRRTNDGLHRPFARIAA